MQNKNRRKQGLNNVREVKKILEGIGHTVEGPGYGVAFYNHRMNPIHRDFFSVFDLMSYDGSKFIGHQVSTEVNKSAKIKAIQESNLPGWVWCRYSEDGTVGYKVYEVVGKMIIEHEMTYGIRRRIKAPY